MAKIIILTGAVQSGKTTLLKQFINEKSDVAGFLMPDINGLRHYYQIENQMLKPFEVVDNTPEEVVSIGRFSFYRHVFNLAQEWLLNVDVSDKKWLVIDEIGKLELRGEGFEPGLSIFLDRIRNLDKILTLIVVVRIGLLEQVRQKYNLANAAIVHNLDEIY